MNLLNSFRIAFCFDCKHEIDQQCNTFFNSRDETTTVNRQPEFTQLDIELSFTQPESIMKLIENVLVNSWPKELPTIPNTFPRMTYEQAMETYGSDKPDTRSKEFLLKNVTNLLRQDTENRNFGAYAIVLPKLIAEKLKNKNDTILKRFRTENKNIEIFQLKNDEVRTSYAQTSTIGKFNLELN